MDRGRTRRDVGLLAAVVILSSLSYVGRIGFYSDDWSFLASLEASKHKGFFGSLRYVARAEHIEKRPLQNVSQLLLFRTFGTHPLGYHLALVAALVGVAAVSYLLLLAVGAPRRMAFAVPAVFVLLPNYSAVHFWFATLTYALTFLAYAVSTYGDIMAVRSGVRVRWGWKALAWAAALTAGLGIETALPLLAANVVCVFAWARWWPGRSERVPSRSLLLSGAGNVVVLLGVAIFKAGTFGDGPSGSLGSNIHGLARGVAVQVVDFGAALPHTTAWAARFLDWWDVLAVVAVVALVAVRLSVVDRGDADDHRSARPWALLVALGAAYYGICAAFFVLSNRFGLTGTGNGNRVWTAATFGWAMVLVGVVGVVVSFIRVARVRRLAWTGAVCVVAASSLVITLGVSHFWIDSNRQENRVMRAIRRTVPALAPDATVLLDGVCPFVGPAPVYRETWDLRGRLAVVYGQPDVTANVVTDRMTFDGGALVVNSSGERTVYRPGPRLQLLRYRPDGTLTVMPLPDAAAAQHALLTSATRGHCPQDGGGGAGVPLLPFDRWLRSH